jgi:hypothetical protein
MDVVIRLSDNDRYDSQKFVREVMRKLKPWGIKINLKHKRIQKDNANTKPQALARSASYDIRFTRLWCTLCRTYGNHVSTECPYPIAANPS